MSIEPRRTDRQTRALATYSILTALLSYEVGISSTVGDAPSVRAGLVLIAEGMGIQRPSAKAVNGTFMESLRREAGIGG